MKDEMEMEQLLYDSKQYSAVQTIRMDEGAPKDLTKKEVLSMLKNSRYAGPSLSIGGAIVIGVISAKFSLLFSLLVLALTIAASLLFSVSLGFIPTTSFNILLLRAEYSAIPKRYLSYARFLKEHRFSLSFKEYTLEGYYEAYPEKKPADFNKVTVPPAVEGSWDFSFATFDKVYKEWFIVESDILVIASYPMYTDMREELAADFHKKLAYAVEVEPAKEDPYDLVHPFIQATAELEIAWKSLSSEAKRVKDSNFEPDERKRLRTARNMLEIAFNGSASTPERQIAYKRALKELRGLVEISESAMFAIEARAGLKQLEA